MRDLNMTQARPFDHITLQGLRFSTLIGVNPEELDEPQPVEIDLDLWLMPSQASRTDQLEQTISYAVIYDQVAHLIHTRHFGLVERLAGAIAELLLHKHTLLMAVDVSVYKPKAPLPGPFLRAGITIHRTRADFGLLTQADLSFGSNLGNRLEILQQAVALFEGHPQIMSIHSSSVYETTPVGILNQPDFYNLALRISTSMNPWDLLDFCQSVEHKFARERTLHGGPRTLDIDLLTYGQIETCSARLELPHPRRDSRDFVRIPLFEIETGKIAPTAQVRFTCKLTANRLE